MRQNQRFSHGLRASSAHDNSTAMQRVQILPHLFVPLVLTPAAAAQLRVDFNSTTQDNGPHPTTGYQSYDAGHEVAADFVPRTYAADFGNGPVQVTLTPAWPSTSSAAVMQMIDRAAAYDNRWVGDDLDLVTDWIGIDARSGAGGNGNWDRVTGSPTYLTLTLAGLPVGSYEWLSFHHDTENVWADFQVEVSTDGGVTFGPAVDKEMTSSSPNGVPTNPVDSTGATDPLPRNLSSTFVTTFDASGPDVVLRFAPFQDGGPNGVHKQIFGMNGFELSAVGGIGLAYCTAVPNSTGAPARMSATGTTSLAAADLVLRAGPVPDQPGVFLYGDGQMQMPWSNGFFCVNGAGGWILPPVFASQNRASLPLSAAGLPAGTFLAGTTWNFQFIHRDPQAGGAQANSSDALSITFVP